MPSPQFSLLALLLIALLLLPAQCAPQRPEAAPTSGNYQVIMWVLGGIPDSPASAEAAAGRQDLYFQRLRDADITAIHISPGDSPDPAISHGFGYYVENIHRIAFLHSAEPIYRADWNGYTSTRDKKYLIRKPCLHDPAYLAQAKRDIQEKVRPYVGRHPLLYDLGDECSITSFASPMDYCFSEYTLGEFRKWLREQYGTLDRLNAEWETSFKSWDDVVPMTTYEIKDREKTGSENYSPWADHRTFMDITFAESWGKFREWVREVDPKTPVGIEGTQMPAAFGGYDLWRLSQVLDWVEAYDAGGAHGIWRSFLPAGTPIYATVFEHDPKPASRRLWHNLLNGDKGCIIWASSEWFNYDSPELTPQPWVAGMGKLFAELRGPAAQAIMNAKRDTAPIAIHYSQPSIQVGWMLDSREDGDTWPRRFSSYEGVHSRITRVRNGWTKLIEDLGLQYDFVSTQQILDGTLQKRGYKALILPQSMAIGDAEAATIKEFAEGGGAVIADCLTGVFDEHGKRRKNGPLDELFGIDRTYSPMVEQAEATLAPGSVWPQPAEYEVRPKEHKGSPMMIQRQAGSGRATYLNFSPIDYAKLRLEGKGGEVRDLIGSILAKAGVKPTIKVTAAEGGPPIGFEVIAYQAEGKRYLAIMRNPEYEASDLGELGYGDNSRFEQPEKVQVEFGAEVQVKDLLAGADLGRRLQLTVTVDPWKPTLLEIR